MQVSVIICTWNNSERLRITLESISHCVIPKGVEWEVVLVNNNCTDTTSRVVDEFSQLLPIVYVEERRQGLSRARNAGLKAAAGGLIVFTDDDVKPTAMWLSSYWSTYQEKPNGFFFGGPVVSDFECAQIEPDLLSAAPRSIKGVDWGPEAKQLSVRDNFLGANWACAKDALQAVGGFNGELGLDATLRKRRVGEESNLMERLKDFGLSPWYVPRARVRHFVPRRKCSFEYLGGNAEALGIYYAAHSPVSSYFLNQRPELKRCCERRIIKHRLYARTTLLWFRQIRSRMLGRKCYESHVSYRFCVGVIKGSRDRSRQRK